MRRGPAPRSDRSATPDPVIAILGAGSSSRMRGGDKLTEEVGGIPLLRLLVDRAASLGHPVLVTLPPSAEARRAALRGTAAGMVEVADAAEGMAASFRAIAPRIAAGAGVMVVLGDMPEITAEDMARLLAAWRADGGHRIARATASDGRPGQPIVFPPRLVPRFADLRGDRGARDIVAAEETLMVPLPGRRALVDLDTPQDWAAWRAVRP